MINLPDIGAPPRERENGCSKKMAAPAATCVDEWTLIIMKPVCEARLVEYGKFVVPVRHIHRGRTH